MQDRDTRDLTTTSLLHGDRQADLVEADIFHMEQNAYMRWVKPTLDFVLGVLGLVVATPLLVVIALVIFLKMGTPVVLTQERMGRHNTPFKLYKFRTMEADRRNQAMPFVGEERRQTHKSADDPRITDLGRWLRASRLDELPQLLNVVLSDISVVGPRPELISVVRNEYEPWQHRRHAVKPGLTGLWQISDRGENRLHECTEIELEYLDKVSLTTDLKIMLATVPALARRSGV